MTRKLQPPPDGELCDIHTGWDTDALGKPVVHRCPNKATVAVPTQMPGGELWLCADHADTKEVIR